MCFSLHLWTRHGICYWEEGTYIVRDALMTMWVSKWCTREDDPCVSINCELFFCRWNTVWCQWDHRRPRRIHLVSRAWATARWKWDVSSPSQTHKATEVGQRLTKQALMCLDTRWLAPKCSWENEGGLTSIIRLYYVPTWFIGYPLSPQHRAPNQRQALCTSWWHQLRSEWFALVVNPVPTSLAHTHLR